MYEGGSFSAGQIVTIYQDPALQRVEKGRAELMFKVSESHFFEVWRVKFLENKKEEVCPILKPL